MIAVGVDPGLTGGVAIINTENGRALVFDMPTKAKHPDETRARVLKEVDARALATIVRENIDAVRVPGGGAMMPRGLVEDVHAIEGFAVQTQGSLVDSFAQAKATLSVMRIPFELINPKRWKGFYGLGSKKAESLKKARILYPDCDGLELAMHEGRAEALLIAHYLVRMTGN